MDRTVEQLGLLLFLMVFYCIGPILALGFALTSIGPGGDIENDLLASVLRSLASDPGAYTGVLHQMIVPVIAAITAANYTSLLSNALSRWLFILPLFTIFVCIADALVFNIIDLTETLGSSEDASGAVGIDPGGAISQFFLNMASTLAVYVMLLVGLKVGGKQEG